MTGSCSGWHCTGQVSFQPQNAGHCVPGRCKVGNSQSNGVIVEMIFPMVKKKNAT